MWHERWEDSGGIEYTRETMINVRNQSESYDVIFFFCSDCFFTSLFSVSKQNHYLWNHSSSCVTLHWQILSRWNYLGYILWSIFSVIFGIWIFLVWGGWMAFILYLVSLIGLWPSWSTAAIKDFRHSYQSQCLHQMWYLFYLTLFVEPQSYVSWRDTNQAQA